MSNWWGNISPFPMIFPQGKFKLLDSRYIIKRNTNRLCAFGEYLGQCTPFVFPTPLPNMKIDIGNSKIVPLINIPPLMDGWPLIILVPAIYVINQLFARSQSLLYRIFPLGAALWWSQHVQILWIVHQARNLIRVICIRFCYIYIGSRGYVFTEV